MKENEVASLHLHHNYRRLKENRRKNCRRYFSVALTLSLNWPGFKTTVDLSNYALLLIEFAIISVRKLKFLIEKFDDKDAAYWRRLGQNLLKEELNKRPINTAAKNVILFLGDG